MAWGHRLKRLTKREQYLCREWGCGAASCQAALEYISTYAYVSARGHATHARRPFCAEHARQFAMRFCLAWPTRDGRVRIRFEVPGARDAA